MWVIINGNSYNLHRIVYIEQQDNILLLDAEHFEYEEVFANADECKNAYSQIVSHIEKWGRYFVRIK